MKNRNTVFTVILLACFGLLPAARAVVPSPDGGYPNFTTAEGQNALFSLSTGTGNTAVGWYSLFGNAAGSFNTAVGAATLLTNTGDNNTAIGAAALLSNTTGSDNTANGALALFSSTEGSRNTAVGDRALFSNTTGQSNTANGAGALYNNTTGSFNIALGNSAGSGVTTAGNAICIGNFLLAANVSNSCFISNIRGVTTVNNNAIPVVIDSAGQLGTTSSSQRFKKKIKPMDNASESIFALKPVTFHYTSDKTDRPEFGLIAEEVAEVDPSLVVHDANGEIYTVRYEAVNAMVLNEFLKEHRKNEKQEATIARLQRQIEALSADLQQVRTQVEMRRAAANIARNNW